LLTVTSSEMKKTGVMHEIEEEGQLHRKWESRDVGGRCVPPLTWGGGSLHQFSTSVKGGKCPSGLEGLGLQVADICIQLLTRTSWFGAEST
jgi:hypothetical protein